MDIDGSATSLDLEIRTTAEVFQAVSTFPWVPWNPPFEELPSCFFSFFYFVFFFLEAQNYYKHKGRRKRPVCVNVVHNSELPICSRLVNDVHRVAILPTKQSQTLVSHSLQHYSTANLLFVRGHADEIDWRFNGHSFTKSGHGQAKIFAALRVLNNMNPPFQNPESTTGLYVFASPQVM